MILIEIQVLQQSASDSKGASKGYVNADDELLLYRTPSRAHRRNRHK